MASVHWRRALRSAHLALRRHVLSEVLRGVDLDVQRSEMVSIVGAFGSGKSTLMNIIGLLDSPSSGSYVLDGREVSAMSDNRRLAIRNTSIGFVFQAFHLLPRLTAWRVQPS